MSELEIFWDAEVPRCGEKDAIGWAQWEALGRIPAQEVDYQRPSRTQGVTDPYYLWFSFEKLMEATGRLPTRSFNEDEDDPYSTILLSDLQPFLSNMTTESSKISLSTAFMSFLGLSTSHAVGEEEWMLNGRGAWVFNPNSLFPPIDIEKRLTWDSYAGTTIAVEHTSKDVFGPVKNWSRIQYPFDGVGLKCNGRLLESGDVTGLDIPTIRSV